MITAIIGANYGDEGKGLAVNYFTREGNNLVVRHNGGAQSGHTVELEDGKRFVFHELSSGSFNNAATYWDSTYHPDLYALAKEYADFYKITNKLPKIYCHKDTTITVIDDIILNWHFNAKEFNTCGMGIWECVCRNNAGYKITVQDIKNMTVEQIYNKLLKFRYSYFIKRLREKEVDNSTYSEMLTDDNILLNYAIEIKHTSESIEIADHSIFDKFDNIVYESGQGLLLDGDYDVENGTPSKTGLYNILNSGVRPDEVVYVTRTYLTRHGKGKFVEESNIEDFDETNLFNKWQGDIKYGKFDSIESLKHRINVDCNIIKPHLFVTHANITDKKILTTNGSVDINTLGFEKTYISENKYTVTNII